jgi:hypothetical protein
MDENSLAAIKKNGIILKRNTTLKNNGILSSCVALKLRKVVPETIADRVEAVIKMSDTTRSNYTNVTTI